MFPTSVLFLAFATLIMEGVTAAPDCSQPPNLWSMKTCCNVPKPNVDSFKTQCGQYMLPMGGHPNPCLLDCMVNATNTITGTSLNTVNARKLLQTIFNESPEFINIYLNGLSSCTSEINAKIADMKANGQSIGDTKIGIMQCSPLPMFYAMCAGRNVFLNCPNNAWTTSPDCSATKEYLRVCKPDDMGDKQSGRAGGPKFNRRSGFF